MNTTKTLLLLILATSLFFLTSCKKKDDPTPPANEEETITTLMLKVKNTLLASDSTQVTWKDLDGNGGNAPTIGTLTLSKNAFYTAQITLLDESQSSHIHNVSEEIQSEKEAHQFFYAALSGVTLTNFAYVDFDANNKPVGLNSNPKTFR